MPFPLQAVDVEYRLPDDRNGPTTVTHFDLVDASTTIKRLKADGFEVKVTVRDIFHP